MIVYGDAERIEEAGEVQAAVLRALRSVEAEPPGLARHSALVGAFIRAGELVQGLVDARFEQDRADRATPGGDAGAGLMLSLAEAVDSSWRSGFRADIGAALHHAARLKCAGPVRTRLGEGYAHYALYPESYLTAARHSGLDARCRVIGIRSIGLGLAAIVAAALGARPPISLRPVSHPFSREIRAEPHLVAGDVADRDVHFAIVDEGPGLSGSSFAAVARWLFAQSVAPGRVHFFPHHEGEPGPQASAETLAVWRAVRRHPASRFDVVAGPTGVERWIADLVGPLRQPLLDITVRDPAGPDAAPPADTRFARRKFLADGEGGRWLVKFAGLGDLGERKLGDAAALAAAGLSPAVGGLRHGFLVQRWVDGEPTAAAKRDGVPRRIGRYLAFRSRRLGKPTAGADLERLREMALVNTQEVLGADAAARLSAFFADHPVLRHVMRPMRTDNRLHAWEWRHSGHAVIKLDAVDHCEAHDLVGCQDIAWDVAGAIVEHGLSRDEAAELCAEIEVGGGPVTDDGLLAIFLPCYLAFQAGLWLTATAADDAAAGAHRQRAASYARRLAGLVDAPGAWPPG